MTDSADQYANQYEYYARRGFLSTYRQLEDQAALNEFAHERVRLFEEKLYLPQQLFRDAALIEFGPDTGENALAFAQFGATLTLVEPNMAAIPNIEQYFQKFNMTKHLRAVVNKDLLGFAATQQYDLIDAEGFIYTIKPTDSWLGAFERILKPGGFFIVTYLERYGCVIEAAMKAAHTALRQNTAADSSFAAELLFARKWAALPNPRPFSTWIKDILESPFIRQRYFLEAADLMRKASNHGFELYSSWPPYRDNSSIWWFKRHIPATERIRLDSEHILRSRIGFMFGCRAYFTGSQDDLGKLDRLTSGIATLFDELVENADNAKTAQLIELLSELSDLIDAGGVLTDKSDNNGLRPLGVANCLVAMTRLMAENRFDSLIEFCNSDPTFLAEWGLPGHFAVFKKPIDG